MVPGVIDEPKKPKKALQNLAHHAADSFVTGFRDVFVVTGGYKYMTDIVGLVAQLVNRSHYYMFENSEKAIDLSFEGELIPKSEELWTKLNKAGNGENVEDLPFIFSHPDGSLNALGKKMWQLWKPEQGNSKKLNE